MENGVESGYFHTKSSLLKGTKVLSGLIIGISDGSGAITAPHLHFTLLINGNLVNPITNLNFRP
jgi:murein DD-endopeptidase MepM/ murein hydrolase activator NlpD